LGSIFTSDGNCIQDIKKEVGNGKTAIEWTGMKINEMAAAAEDRDCWRGILRAANPAYGERH